MRLPLFLMGLLLLGCESQTPPIERAPPLPRSPLTEVTLSNKSEDQLGDYVSFPSAGVKIRAPKGLNKANNFTGFGDEAEGVSVLAIRRVAPFSEISKGFTEAKMKELRWVLLSKEEKTIAGQMGILVHFEQPAQGQRFLKWSWIFGGKDKTVMVTGTFPKEQEGKYSQLVKAAVLSTQEEDLGEDKSVPFTLGKPEKMKPTRLVSGTLAFTKDGVIPIKSPKDPIFVAAPGLGKKVTGDPKEFANLRLRQTSHTRGVTLLKETKVTVDGLPGWEMIAAGEDLKSGDNLVVYQLLLFEGDTYYAMQGMVGVDISEEYLKEFQALGKSFKRKEKTIIK